MDEESPRTWTIDADAPLQLLLDDPACHLLLQQSLTGVLSWQTRNETTVRRVLAAPRLAPQFVAALLALGALATVAHNDSAKEVPLTEMLLEPGERAAALRVPLVRELRTGRAQVARTPADAPIVAAYAAVEVHAETVRAARVALTGVWRRPAQLARAASQLVGGPLSPDRIEAAASAVRDEVAPEGDYLGSEEYRRAMAAVLTRRALRDCLH